MTASKTPALIMVPSPPREVRGRATQEGDRRIDALSCQSWTRAVCREYSHRINCSIAPGTAGRRKPRSKTSSAAQTVQDRGGIRARRRLRHLRAIARPPPEPLRPRQSDVRRAEHAGRRRLARGWLHRQGRAARRPHHRCRARRHGQGAAARPDRRRLRFDHACAGSAISTARCMSASPGTPRASRRSSRRWRRS